MEDESAENYVRLLLNPEEGKLGSLQEKLKSGDKHWAQQFVQAGGMEVLLSHLCLWTQYPDTFPVEEYTTRAKLCAECLFEILGSSIGLNFFLLNSDYTTRLTRCLSYQVTDVKKIIVKLLSTFCMRSAKGYGAVLDALHDYKTYNGSQHYLYVIVDEIRYCAFPEYREWLLILLNCIMHKQDYNGRAAIRNQLNDLEFTDLLKDLDVETYLMQTHVDAFNKLEEKDKGKGRRHNLSSDQHEEEEKDDDSVFDEVDGFKDDEALSALNEDEVNELKKLSAENLSLLNLFIRMLLSQPGVITQDGTLPQVLQRFTKDHNVDNLVDDLLMNITALDTGDVVDGGVPPAPVFGLQLPSPLVGTSWVDNQNAMSLFSRKPTRKMKRLQWTKLNPDLSDASVKSVWKEVLRLADSVDINVKALEENFAEDRIPSKRLYVSKSRMSEGIDLELKRRQKIDITLKSLKTETIMEKLRQGRTDGITINELRKIVDTMPNQEEVKMVKNLKVKDKSELKEAERFFLLFDDFPKYKNYQVYIRGLLLEMELPAACAEMRRQMDEFTHGCEGLMNCAQLKSFLRLVLNTGNFINSGTHAGNAIGFCISDLLKLQEVRSSKNEALTLLHHLIEEIQRQNPTVLSFIEELRRHVPNITSLDVDQIREDLNSFTDQLHVLSSVRDQTVRKYFKDFCQREETVVRELKDQLLAVEKLYEEMQDYFYEKGTRSKFNDLLESLKQLCYQVKGCQQEMTSRTRENKQQHRRSITFRHPGGYLDHTDAAPMDEAIKCIHNGSFRLTTTASKWNI